MEYESRKKERMADATAAVLGNQWEHTNSYD